MPTVIQKTALRTFGYGKIFLTVTLQRGLNMASVLKQFTKAVKILISHLL